MRERLERMLGRQARAAWILTFHAACGRMLRREAERLGYRSSFTIYDQADQIRVVKACLEDLGVDPEAVHTAGHPQPDLEREEPADRPRRVHEPRRLVLRPDGGRGVRALPEAADQLERGRLRRHADAHGRGARAVPRRRSPTGSTPSATSSWTSIRTRTTRSTACCSCSPPSTGTCSPSATRISRSTASAAPTSATSSTSSATSPEPSRSRWSRTTARRTRSSARPTR